MTTDNQTQALTDEQIAELERLEREAVAPEWRVPQYDAAQPSQRWIELVWTADDLFVRVTPFTNGDVATCELVAKSRNLLPLLLAERSALIAEKESVEVQLDWHKRTLHSASVQSTAMMHPNYGPCDGLGLDDGCSECQRVVAEGRDAFAKQESELSTLRATVAKLTEERDELRAAIAKRQESDPAICHACRSGDHSGHLDSDGCIYVNQFNTECACLLRAPLEKEGSEK